MGLGVQDRAMWLLWAVVHTLSLSCFFLSSVRSAARRKLRERLLLRATLCTLEHWLGLRFLSARVRGVIDNF